MEESHEQAFQIYKQLIQLLSEFNKSEGTRSRPLSIAITDLETSAMWFNKHRAEKGYLPKNPTHIQ
jgi:hypothetical protein